MYVFRCLFWKLLLLVLLSPILLGSVLGRCWRGGIRCDRAVTTRRAEPLVCRSDLPALVALLISVTVLSALPLPLPLPFPFPLLLLLLLPATLLVVDGTGRL